MFKSLNRQPIKRGMSFIYFSLRKRIPVGRCPTDKVLCFEDPLFARPMVREKIAGFMFVGGNLVFHLGVKPSSFNEFFADSTERFEINPGFSFLKIGYGICREVHSRLEGERIFPLEST